MAENQAENNLTTTSSNANPHTETPQTAAVRAAREAFFARAPSGNGSSALGSTSEVMSDVQPAATATNHLTTQSQQSGGAPSDAPVAAQSAQQRIASRNDGEGLLAVSVLSDLGSERAYRVWATGDSDDLKLITDPQAREKAFEAIIDNMRNPQYREALALVDYGLERDALREFNARSTGVDSNFSSALENNGASSPEQARVTPDADVSSNNHAALVSSAASVADLSAEAPQVVPQPSESLVSAAPSRDLEKAIAKAQVAEPIDQPIPAPIGAADAPITTTATPIAESGAAMAGSAEENVIEAGPALRRDRSPDNSSDQGLSDEKKRLEADKVAGRGPAGRLLEAFARSLIGRDQPSKSNEIFSPAVMTKTGYAVPEAVASRYVVRDGDFWRFDEKDPGNKDNHKPKFTDTGPRLSSAGHDRGTVADMVTVAQAKGWQQVTLKGTEEFRRNAWIEANLAGMKTRGFNPKEQDRAMLEQARRERDALTITAGRRSPEVPRPASPPSPTLTPTPTSTTQPVNTSATVSAVAMPTPAGSVGEAPTVATSSTAPVQPAQPVQAADAAQVAQMAQTVPQTPSSAPDPERASLAVPEAPAAAPVSDARSASVSHVAPKQPAQKILLKHGAAPYKNDQDNAPSYFVSYSDAAGATQTVWGKDLERAVRESGVKPGDPLTLENLGSRPVTVNRPIKDAEGKVVRVDQIDTHLNVWDIQKQEKQSPGRQEPGATAVNVAGLREQIEKALANQPENVVREVMDRLAERLQSGMAVQTAHRESGAPAQDLKPAIDTRLAQVDVDREARQAIAEVATPKRSLDPGMSKQNAPSMTR